jgi:hypothetical protein
VRSKSAGQSDMGDESVDKPDSVRSLPTVAIIHLRPLLPAAWCDLPGGSGEQPSIASADARTRPFDLAPGGVYRAIPVTWDAGGLLHRRFTLTSVSMRWLGNSLVVRGGLLSVALSRGSPRVGVTHHLALWSPDFPQRRPWRRRDRPTDSSNPSLASNAKAALRPPRRAQ